MYNWQKEGNGTKISKYHPCRRRFLKISRKGNQDDMETMPTDTFTI